MRIVHNANENTGDNNTKKKLNLKISLTERAYRLADQQNYNHAKAAKKRYASHNKAS